MTRTRKAFIWTLASLVVLLAALVVIIAFFDWNRIKPSLNAKVSEELHRPFAINGNLAVIWQREPEEGGWRAWLPLMAKGRCNSSETLALSEGLMRFQLKKAMTSTNTASKTTRLAKLQARIFEVRVMHKAPDDKSASATAALF